MHLGVRALHTYLILLWSLPVNWECADRLLFLYYDGRVKYVKFKWVFVSLEGLCDKDASSHHCETLFLPFFPKIALPA